MLQNKKPVHLALVQKDKKQKSCAFTVHVALVQNKQKSYAFATCVQ